MGFFYLNVLESRGKEAGLELIASQGTGDAASPLLHVLTGLLGHVRIRDHVRDSKPTAWTKHLCRWEPFTNPKN